MTATGWIGIGLLVGFWGLLWLAAVRFGPDSRDGRDRVERSSLTDRPGRLFD